MAKKKTGDDAKKKSNKPKIIGAVVIALVGYKFFLAPKPTPAKADAPPKEGMVVALPDLTINLADADPKYLRVGVALILEAGTTAEAMKDEVAKASDVAVTLLSKQTYATLHDVDKRSGVKDELSKETRAAFDNKKVVRVIFTSFVMQ